MTFLVHGWNGSVRVIIHVFCDGAEPKRIVSYQHNVYDAHRFVDSTRALYKDCDVRVVSIDDVVLTDNKFV